MIVNGIIAEYNPFHTGHAYQLAEAKSGTGADYTIVIMSGNYVQRGTPAIMDKTSRTRMALEGGADLVLELPCIYSTGSAEYFAKGAVNMLNRLGVVDHLCFGSETDDLLSLQTTADILAAEPPAYRLTLQAALKNGMSFPAAREEALRIMLPEDTDLSFLAAPNNVLGIEYLKALQLYGSTMKPHITVRRGSDYHSETLKEEYVSAQALRSVLKSNELHGSVNTEGVSGPGKDFSELSSYTDTAAIHRYALSRALLCENDFSQALYLRLLEETNESLQQYLDVSKSLANRICTLLPQYNDYSGFCDALKTKDMTYARISRCLLHILLRIPDYKPEDTAFSPDYVRVLGFRKEAAPLLSEIGKHSSLQLLSKPADAKEKLSEKDYALFLLQVKADMLYAQASVSGTGTKPTNEYTAPLIIL